MSANRFNTTFGGRRVETLKTSELLRLIMGQGGSADVQRVLADELDARIPARPEALERRD